MTVRDVLECTGRRWYVLALVIVAAVALTVLLGHDGGAYVTRTTVTFTVAERPTLLPESGASEAGVIAFAGAIATEINNGRPVPTYSSSDAPFYGAGTRAGVTVSLRNAGNQWTASFPSATIDIQIVARSRAEVEEQQSRILAEVMQITHAQQEAALTPASDRISAVVDPLSRQIDAVAATRTQQMLAVAAVSLAALLTGIWACVVVDTAVRRRRRRPARSGRRRLTMGGSYA